MTSTPSPASVLTCGHPNAGLRGPNGECMVPGCYGTQPCTARNTWTDSGDRGAAKHDHDRHYHPTHEHVWGPSTYAWEQAGEPHIAPGDRTNITPRPETVTRCVECGIRPEDDKAGKCNSSVSM